MNFNFFSGGKWNLEEVVPPWKDRPSIYQHIIANIRSGEPGLGEKRELLPDEEIVRGDNQFGWAPGAFEHLARGSRTPVEACNRSRTPERHPSADDASSRRQAQNRAR